MKHAITIEQYTEICRRLDLLEQRVASLDGFRNRWPLRQPAIRIREASVDGP
jgi:hypothetical protein